MNSTCHVRDLPASGIQATFKGNKRLLVLFICKPVLPTSGCTQASL